MTSGTRSAIARGMRLLAHDTLLDSGNGGEGMALHEAAGRRYLYVAHESAPVDFTVLDVTDPRRPRVAGQRKLPHDGVRSNSLGVGDGILTVAYQVKTAGTGPAGLGIYDLSDPAEPEQIAFYDAAGPQSRGTHGVWWVGGGTAYLSTGTGDSRPTHPRDDQFPVIVDLTNPAKPSEIGRWWLPGTQEGDDAPPAVRLEKLDIGHRAHNIHVFPQRPDRAYVGYFDSGAVILDISDRAVPRLISRLDYHPPFNGVTHTVLPLLSRDLLAITDEAVVDGSTDYPKLLWLADMSYEQKPVLIGTAPMPRKEEFIPLGGRFGAHNIHMNQPVPTAWKSETILVGAFFSAGVRVYDTTDPFRPDEIAYYVPEAPTGSGGKPIQINHVYVDENAIVYAVDRLSGGLYVLEMN